MINLKKREKTIIGMVHVAALPGSPLSSLPVSEIVRNALFEATDYISCGIDSIMIENMHDVPYLKGTVGPEIVASMSVLAVELRKITDKPLGIQILAGANKEALAVALASGFDFIRVEGYVFGHVADEGYIDSCAGELLRYRKQIGAENIAIFTDVKKKHSSHSITSDVSLTETVKAAEFFLSDGIIITGKSTGDAADLEHLAEAGKVTTLPVIVGSGITTENISDYWNYADAFIIGSYFKQGGNWENGIDKKRVGCFLEKVNQLRSL